MPSTARSAETMAFENARSTPFTRIHGRPSRSDYEILKQEAASIASEVEDITHDWSRDAGTGDEYGLLAEILGVDEYDHQTGISTYVEATEPATYDGTIDDTTPTTRANAKRKNGNASARAGTSAKDSSRASLQTFVMQLTSNTTPS